VFPSVTSQFNVGVQDKPEDCNRNPHNLTQRELKVLYLLTEGLADKQIAVALGVTVYTVNKHVGAILAKMCVSSRTAAAVCAVREHSF
jgi:DNA-binding NarL/FixJ family response regulator